MVGTSEDIVNEFCSFCIKCNIILPSYRCNKVSCIGPVYIRDHRALFPGVEIFFKHRFIVKPVALSLDEVQQRLEPVVIYRAAFKKFFVDYIFCNLDCGVHDVFSLLISMLILKFISGVFRGNIFIQFNFSALFTKESLRFFFKDSLVNFYFNYLLTGGLLI